LISSDFYQPNAIDVIGDLDHIIDACKELFGVYPFKIETPKNFPYYTLIYREVKIYQEDIDMYRAYMNE